MEKVSSVATALVMDNRGAGRSDNLPDLRSTSWPRTPMPYWPSGALPAHIVGSSMGGYVP